MRIAEDAFGAVALPTPKLIDLLPPPLISLSHRVLARGRRGEGFASGRSRRVITAAAVGLAFVGWVAWIARDIRRTLDGLDVQEELVADR